MSPSDRDRNSAPSQKTIDPLPLLIFYIDSNLKYRMANAAHERWFGRARDELIGKTLAEALGPEIEATLNPGLSAALSGKETRLEGSLPTQDGMSRFISASFVPDLSDRGHAAGFIGTVEDITDRKRTEAARITTELRLASVIENAPSVFSLKDRHGRYLVANVNFERLLGIPSDSVIGKTDLELFPAEVAQAIRRNDEEVFSARERKSFEERIPRKDGEFLTFASYKFPIFAANGEPECICSISVDVTSERSAKAELLRWKHLFDHASWGMGLATPDSKVIAVNAAFARMHGTSPVEWPGRPVSDMFAEESKGLLPQVSQLANESGHIVYESIHVRKDGTKFPVLSDVTAYKDERGVVLFRAANFQDITERKRAEDALRSSERKFATLFSSAPIPIALSRASDGLIFDVNPAFEELLGFSRSECVGKTSVELGILLASQARAEIRAEITARGEIRNREYRLRTRSGRIIIAMLSMKGIELDGTQYLLSSLLDVTQRRQAEHDLEAERTKLREMLMQAPVIISVTTGPDHVFEIFNHEASRGIGGRDCTGLPILKALPELKNSAFIEALNRVYETGQTIRLNESPADLVQPDGSIKRQYFNVIYHPWRNVVGDIAGIMNVSMNVTEQVEARRKVEQAQREFRILADNISQLVWMTHSDGRVFWYNQRWFQYTGTTTKQMEGWGWQSVLVPEQVSEIAESWTHALSTGQPYEMIFPIRGADGRYRRFLTRALPVRDADGNVIRWFGTNTDIEAEMSAKEALESAVQARDDFLSIASHELKTPLTTLMLQIQSAARGLSRGDPRVLAPERLTGLIEQMEKQLARLSRLVNDMLDISRIRSGKLAIEPREFELCQLVREVKERIKPQFVQSGGREPELIACEPVLVRWDPLRIEQVIVNLLTNANRYGQGKPVEIRVENLGDRVRLSVRDQGMGIAKEDQERIFNRFERAISANEVSGLGLGLYIVRQIIEAHGGKIWVESGPSEGSTFFVEIPEKPLQ